MAREISVIQEEMSQKIQSTPELAGLNSPSATAIWRLWTFIFATAIHIHESFLDIGIIEMENIARDAVPGTPQWLQRRCLEFQYDADNPQIVSVQPDGSVKYNTIDESLRVVTRCSVVETETQVVVKTATGDADSLQPLDTQQLSALRSYLDEIGFAGIILRAESFEPDVFVLDVNVVYDAQFVGDVVKQNIVDAMKTYLSDLSINQFDGVVVREHVVDTIQKVDGVIGLDSQGMEMRAQYFGQPFQLITGRTYTSNAGYLTFDDVVSNITLTPNNDI